MNTHGNSRHEEPMSGLEQVRSVRLSIASPAEIRAWSSGEVTRPVAFESRVKSDGSIYSARMIAEGGLLCQKIFGPVASYRCLCGNYSGDRLAKMSAGVVCDRCGVLVADRSVRRHRMGHIELASPVVHPFFYRGSPSYLTTLFQAVLDVQDERGIAVKVTKRWLERIVNGNMWVRLDNETTNQSSLVTGAECIAALLRQLREVDVAELLRGVLGEKIGSSRKRETLATLIALFESAEIKPEWMVLEVLPVVPPVSRQTSVVDENDDSKERIEIGDLNRLYGRVIRANNALKELIAEEAPEELIFRRKRSLQQAVAAVFENESLPHPVKNLSGRPLGSIMGLIKGKEGRFRGSLLGKRVDYSGRSAIVGNPKLRLWQCGLPEKIAWKLYRPFVIRKLNESGRHGKSSKFKPGSEASRQALKVVMSSHPVLLNRAPTLHRMNVQAFYPVLTTGNAIEVHPLVCKSFTADFDGDQMAVHLPLSIEAQTEAHVQLASVHNLLSPASGKVMFGPSQDMVMGLYYLTMVAPKQDTAGVFGCYDELDYGRATGKLTIHDTILFRLAPVRKVVGSDGECEESTRRVRTTVGRAMFNWLLGDRLPFYNVALNSKVLSELLANAVETLGSAETVTVCEKLAEIGFDEATKSGLSIGIQDLTGVPSKQEIITRAQQKIMALKDQLALHALEPTDYQERFVSTWVEATEEVANELMHAMERRSRETFANPVFVMTDSGARGTVTQVKQLAGMRGLITKVSGKVSGHPITSNFREGLLQGEFFVSTHGARKSFTYVGLQTAKGGYLSRRLVHATSSVVVTETDCDTTRGVVKTREAGPEEFAKLLRGRVNVRAIRRNGSTVVGDNELITHRAACEIAALRRRTARVRSPLTCEAKRGICQLCYGEDLSTGRLVELGTAVGVIAGQSIGEPGTQLTINTKHTGGVLTGKDMVGGIERVEELLEARCKKLLKIAEDGTEQKICDYLLRELPLPYAVQGVLIDDKHFEIVIRQMLGFVRVDGGGDTGLVEGAIVERSELKCLNDRLPKSAKRAAGHVELLGISRVAMAGDGFLAAAGFREPKHVLREASLRGERDTLSDVTAKVITGGMVPVGTGFLNGGVVEKGGATDVSGAIGNEEQVEKKSNKRLPVRVVTSPRERKIKQSVEELLPALGSGVNDKDIWDQIIVCCWDKLYAGIRRADGVDDIVARRLTSKVFRGVMRSKGRFANEKGFWKFVWQRRDWTVKNYIARELKRRKRERTTLLELMDRHALIPEAELSAKRASELLDRIRQEATLTDNQQRIFELACIKGLSDSEVAKRLKKTSTAIRRTKSHIKKKLRETPTVEKIRQDKRES